MFTPAKAVPHNTSTAITDAAKILLRIQMQSFHLWECVKCRIVKKIPSVQKNSLPPHPSGEAVTSFSVLYVKRYFGKCELMAGNISACFCEAFPEFRVNVLNISYTIRSD